MKVLFKTAAKTLIISLVASVFLTACSKSEPTASTSAAPVAEATEKVTIAPSTAAAETTAPTAKPLENVTIDFWHAFGEGEEKVLKEDVLPAFEKLNPTIKVNAIRMPTENLDAQVLTAAAGGAVPDLMRMDNTWISRFAKEGALQTVEGFPGFDQVVANSFKAPMDTNLFNGKYYGVPLDTNTRVAIYNKELLKLAGATEPPKTMDELVTLAKNLKAKGKYYGITIGGANTWDISAFFWTLGGKYTDDKFATATGFINSPESIKALETIVSWNADKLLAPPILGGAPGTWEGLRGDKGVAANYMMITDGPWFFSILGDAVKDTMIAATIPKGPDGQSHSIIGGQDLVIFKDAKHPNEAWTFSQYMLSEEVQTLMTLKTGAIPTNTNAAKSEKLKDVYYLQAYVDEMATAFARTPTPRWNEISELIGTSFESVLRKKSTAKEALDKAAKEIDAILATTN
ncbi:extracellular solute-binding protein [Paenibacillus psychroresistens]|uniref:Extracellular solute-binding protein n=1 Tax=Paenibacillus psychroresistens TaxID=1778678 RepID=A0A6B8RQ97_9BACL|nr:extracellular solute-binding protein [Paenibacillus psychroresistens]QGQ97974.1 extracellular solute-binding protein [Paenibacillus psychroresistens]